MSIQRHRESIQRHRESIQRDRESIQRHRESVQRHRDERSEAKKRSLIDRIQDCFASLAMTDMRSQ